jgi:cell division transport system permease protein
MANANDASKWRAFLHGHAFSLISALGRFARAPVPHVLTLGVIAVALALPTLCYLALANAKTLTGGLDQAADINVFLALDATAEQAEQLRDSWQNDPLLQSVTVKTPSIALAEFRSLTAYSDALDALQQNPLPFVVALRLKARVGAPPPTALLDKLHQTPGVDMVQFDQEWLYRLQAVLNLATALLWVFGTLLGLSVLLVIGNTVRLEIQARRDEIHITKLIGGTDAFVRRPFLYSGLWFGLFGALLALLLVALALWVLGPAVFDLARSYGTKFYLTRLRFSQGIVIVGIGLGLGLIGAFLASWRHLSETDPQ